MLLAYIDESGNTGAVSGGASLTYTLGCVLVDADIWPDAFDQLLDFRRRVKDKFGVHMRAEIKANYLLRNSGDLRPYALGPDARRIIYRAHMSVLAQLPARAFAVVIDKRNQPELTPTEYFDLAWETLLQRLERTSYYEKATFAVFHDEGEDDAIRRWVRRSRRHLTSGRAFGPGSSNNPARRLVDDPVPRRSDQSYFIQMADLVAYAAFRAVVPPGPSIARVCPDTMWDVIGPATHTAVSKVKPRSKPGIVLR
ncbi:MAG: DUF3800 domain-containing protein [Nocardioides sp.]|uniref:DUF3800 domain-containing protein n=1 Tax=Nocardioides sp. TaxID=35761 RepID=UPI0039E6B337